MVMGEVESVRSSARRQLILIHHINSPVLSVSCNLLSSVRACIFGTHCLSEAGCTTQEELRKRYLVPVLYGK